MNSTQKQKKTPVLEAAPAIRRQKRLYAFTGDGVLVFRMVLMPMVYIHKIVSGIILSNNVDAVSIRH